MNPIAGVNRINPAAGPAARRCIISASFMLSVIFSGAPSFAEPPASEEDPRHNSPEPSSQQEREAAAKLLNSEFPGALLDERTRELLSYANALYGEKEAVSPKDESLTVSSNLFAYAMRNIYGLAILEEMTVPNFDEYFSNPMMMAGREYERNAQSALQQARDVVQHDENLEFKEPTDLETQRAIFLTTSFQCLEDKGTCDKIYGWLDCELVMLVCLLEKVMP